MLAPTIGRIRCQQRLGGAVRHYFREPVDPAQLGEIQRFTPTIGALVTPDVDRSLDEQDAKNRFWSAFRTLGTWWAELPPY